MLYTKGGKDPQKVVGSMRVLRLGLVSTVMLALLIVVAGTAQPGRGADAPQTWAVVVGINDYIRNSITDLNYAGPDAKLYAQALKEVAKVPDSNIFVFTSDTVDESLQPKLTNIIFRLDWLRKNAKPNDTVIFYFAGHGVTVEGEPFLLTEEADNRSLETLKISALRGADVAKLMSKIPALNSLILLDACRNDPSSGRGDASNQLDDKLSRALTFVPDPALRASAPTQTRPSSACLFACSVGERSWEWDDKKHGYFTYYLVEGMRSGAKTDPSGAVSLQALVDYISENVKTSTQRHAAASQNPMFRYEGPGAATVTLCSRTPNNSNLAYGNDAKRDLNAAKEIAKLDALRAELEATQARERAAQEKVKLAEAERRTIELRAQDEMARRQLLESRMAQLETQIQSGPNPAEVARLKAELDKSKADADAARQTAANAAAALEKARLDSAKAEKLALEAGSSQKKAAEAARLEALARENEAKAREAEAREKALAAQNSELQKKMAMLESSLKDTTSGNQANQARSASLEAQLAEAQKALAAARKDAESATMVASNAQQARVDAQTRLDAATTAGQKAQIEAERAKLAEARAQEAQQQARAEEMRRVALETEKKELEHKLSLLEAKAPAAATVATADLEKKLKEREESERLLRDQLALQEQARQMAEARLRMIESKVKEADVRKAEFTISAQASDMAMANKPGDAKKEGELKAELERLRTSNAKLELEKRDASRRAREAETQVAHLEDDMERKWGGRAFGPSGRITRRIRLEDLTGVLKAGPEATELPGGP